MELGKNGKLSYSSNIYIKNVIRKIDKLMETYFQFWKSPLTGDYCPKLESTPFLKGSEVAKY